MRNIAKVHRDAMREVLVRVQDMPSNLARAIDANGKVLEQIGASSKNATMIINQAFKQLSQRIEERKMTLLSHMDTISVSKATALSRRNTCYRCKMRLVATLRWSPTSSRLTLTTR